MTLEDCPTLDKIKIVVWACGTDKAIGYNVFNFKFFTEMWDEISADVFRFIQDFLETGITPSMVNVT